jgi:hypothetical protein
MGGLPALSRQMCRSRPGPFRRTPVSAIPFSRRCTHVDFAGVRAKTRRETEHFVTRRLDRAIPAEESFEEEASLS